MTYAKFNNICNQTLLLVYQNVPAGTIVDPVRTVENPCSANHLSWMLQEANIYFGEGKTNKADRWLGFVQGVITAQAGATIEELRRINTEKE